MCKRHSFIVSRDAKVHDGYGITDSHTNIRALAGLGSDDSTTYAFEWQPPAGWPNANLWDGMTQDTAPIPNWQLKERHDREIRRHIQSLYPDLAAWEVGDQPRALPEGLSVGGSLYLSGTPITALPEGLSVGGYLYLSGTPITALPEGLSVGGSLDLSGTPITALPEGLSVGRYLYLSGTPITNVPAKLQGKVIR